MAKGGSVAPKERVNITYRPATGDAPQEVELPLKILAIGDYKGCSDDTPIEERRPVRIDKDNFDHVMKEHGLALDIAVPDRLSDQPGNEVAVQLKFESLRDFQPEGIARQVPELRKLLEIRAALTALKGPLGNVPAFRKSLQRILGDQEARRALITELGLEADENESDGGEATS